MPVTVGMPDLPSFRVVQPRDDVKLSDMELSDGTKMIGPDGLLIPPARNFSAIYNAATRVYSSRFDEAMRDNFVAARAMRRDGFLDGLFEERVLPTINRTWALEVDDDTDPAQAFVRDGLTKVISSIPDFDQFKRANLDGVWFGRAGCQWSYKRDDEIDDLWAIPRWDPLHGDSIQYTFDGVPAILLDSLTTSWYADHGAKWGTKGDGDLRSTDRGGNALVLQRPYWRSRFTIHSHIRRKADYFEGELAGSVQGLGLRGQVYWLYTLRTDALTWMIAYMQAVGAMDLLVFNYPAGNDAAKRQQEANANKVIGKAAIVCPRNPTGNWPAVEQVQMNAAGLKALHDLVADYFDRHIERLFVGQSMSSGADKGDGLGGTGRSEFAKACVPVEGSEILTRSGFKSPHNAVIGEDVLAYDAETDRCRWTPLLKKSFYDDCEVSRLWTGQNRFDVVCTPDHSWAVENVRFVNPDKPPPEGAVRGPRGAWRYPDPSRSLKQAKEVGSRDHVILAAPFDGDPSESVLTPTEAAVLGWVITDGTIKTHDCRFKGIRYELSICQSKEKHLDAIRDLMQTFTGRVQELVIDFPARSYPKHSVSGRVVAATLPQRWWRASRDQSTRLLNKCGFRTRADLPHIVTRLDAPARKAMLDAMLAGDGSADGSFYNTDPHVWEAFDILCALEGKAVGRPKSKEPSDPAHKKYTSKHIRQSRYVYGDYLQLDAAGRADVWCPTTKYGTWVMRQNGHVTITGNTKDEILVYDTGRLDSTFTYDLVRPLKKYNYPWAKFPVRFKSVVPDLKAKDKVESGKVMVDMGLPIKSKEFRAAADYSKPDIGDEVIAVVVPGAPPVITVIGSDGKPEIPPEMLGPPPGMGPEIGPDGMPLLPGAPSGMGGMPPGPPGSPPAGPGGPPTQMAAAGPVGPPNAPYVAGMGYDGGTPGGGIPPVNGPTMGRGYYPGGSNTHLPQFRDRRHPNDVIGFTRYARTDRVPTADVTRTTEGVFRPSAEQERLLRTGRARIAIVPVEMVDGLAKDRPVPGEPANEALRMKKWAGHPLAEVVERGLRFELRSGNAAASAWRAGGNATIPVLVRQPDGTGANYERRNSPPGGVTFDGREYRAGRFLPGTVMFQHTPRIRAPGAYGLPGTDDAFDPEQLAAGTRYELPHARGDERRARDRAKDRLQGNPDFYRQLEYDFDESQHPRDDHGRFVDKEEMEVAKSDPQVAHELRGRVNDPAERAKLDAAIGPDSGAHVPKPSAPAQPKRVRGPEAHADYRSRAHFEESVLPAFEDPNARAEAETVLRRVPDSVVQRLSQSGGVRSVIHYAAGPACTDQYYHLDERDGNPTPRGRPMVGGFYDHETGTVHTDSGDVGGTFAHELGHGIDLVPGGNGEYLSDSDEWRYVWSRELKGGRLSEYARTNPAEGFAELCRWVYSNDGDVVGTSMQLFPGAIAFFQKHGLVEGGNPTGSFDNQPSAIQDGGVGNNPRGRSPMREIPLSRQEGNQLVMGMDAPVRFPNVGGGPERVHYHPNWVSRDGRWHVREGNGGTMIVTDRRNSHPQDRHSMQGVHVVNGKIPEVNALIEQLTAVEGGAK